MQLCRLWCLPWCGYQGSPAAWYSCYLPLQTGTTPSLLLTLPDLLRLVSVIAAVQLLVDLAQHADHFELGTLGEAASCMLQ